MLFSLIYLETKTTPHEFKSLIQIQNYIQSTFSILNYSIFYQSIEIESDIDLSNIINNLLIPNVSSLSDSKFIANNYQFTIDLYIISNEDEIDYFYTNQNSSSKHNIRKWKFIKELGRGAFGRVFLAIYGNQYYAVKASKRKKYCSLVQIRNELELLKNLSHPNVIQYLAYEIDKSNKAFMAMEYLSRGSLSDILKKSGAISLNTCRKYSKQLLAAIIYIHNKNIIHRDIKCGNCLLDNNGNLKLSDFGLATQHLPINIKNNDSIQPNSSIFQENSYLTSSLLKDFVGTTYFMAPEVIQASNKTLNIGYSFPADIWSLGLTVVEMLTTKAIWSNFKPFEAISLIVNSNNFQQAKKLLIHSGISSDENGFLIFLSSVLEYLPENRPNAMQIASGFQFFKLNFQ